MIAFVFYLIGLLAAAPLIRAEVYSSASDMRSIFQLERDIVDIIAGYADRLEQKLQRINNYLAVSLRLHDMHCFGKSFTDLSHHVFSRFFVSLVI